MEYKEEYTTPLGTFRVKEDGTCFIVCDFSKHPYEELETAEIFESNGLKGCIKDGIVLCPPIFDDIIVTSNKGAFYLVKGGQTAIFYENGRNIMGTEFDPDNNFFEIDNKIGWKRNGEILFPPEYDDISYWDFLKLYRACKDYRVKYFTEEGQEVLTFRRQVEGDCEEPFSLRTDDKDVLTIIECPPLKDLPSSNVLKFKDNHKIGIDRFDSSEIIRELINPDDELPLTRKKLEGLTNEFSYEFSAYRFTVEGEDSIEKLLELFKAFNVNDNSWFYVIRLTTPEGESIPGSELLKLSDFLDNNRNITLGRAIAIGHDNSLEKGETSALIITHYNEACFPPKEKFDWLDVCRKGEIEDVKIAYRKLAEFIEKDIVEEYKGDFLIDCLDSTFYNIHYSSHRSWEETRKVLDFLSTKSKVYREMVWNNLKRICHGDNSNEVDFAFNYLEWILDKSGNINVIRNKQTLVDYVKSSFTQKPEKNREIKEKTLHFLESKGGKSYSEVKNDFLKDHSEYEFALKILSGE